MPFSNIVPISPVVNVGTYDGWKGIQADPAGEWDDSANCVAYGNGLWLVGGLGINSLMYSITGRDNWTPIAEVYNQDMLNGIVSIAYGNNHWVITQPLTKIGYSSSGRSNWTFVDLSGIVLTISRVYYGQDLFGNDKWFVSGSYYNEYMALVSKLIYSPTGTTDWTEVLEVNGLFNIDPIISHGYDVDGNDLWLVGGSSDTDYTVYYSTTGLDNFMPVLGSKELMSRVQYVYYANGIWMLSGWSPDTNLFYSFTGVDGWTPVVGMKTILPLITAISYFNGLWVAVGNGNDNSIAYSTSGIDNWIGVPRAYNEITQDNAYGVAHNDSSLWVVCGSAGANNVKITSALTPTVISSSSLGTTKVVLLPDTTTVPGSSYLIRDSGGFCSFATQIHISTTTVNDTIDLYSNHLYLSTPHESVKVISNGNGIWSILQNYKQG